MKLVRGVVWFFRDYLSRHTNNWNRALHIIGVPLAPFGCIVLLALQRWWWAAGAFVVGYALQWLGHHIEGNEVGEWILIKHIARRLTGKAGREPERESPGDGGDRVPGPSPR